MFQEIIRNSRFTFQALVAATTLLAASANAAEQGEKASDADKKAQAEAADNYRYGLQLALDKLGHPLKGREEISYSEFSEYVKEVIEIAKSAFEADERPDFELLSIRGHIREGCELDDVLALSNRWIYSKEKGPSSIVLLDVEARKLFIIDLKEHLLEEFGDKPVTKKEIDDEIDNFTRINSQLYLPGALSGSKFYFHDSDVEKWALKNLNYKMGLSEITVDEDAAVSKVAFPKLPEGEKQKTTALSEQDNSQ